MRETARRAFVAALIFGGVIVFALALWKLRVLIALIFLAFIIAAAMGPGIEAMRRRRIPRGVGVLLHYAALLGLFTLLLWLVVPRALDQVQNALGDLPSTRSELRSQAEESTGLRREVLEGVQQRLEELPSASDLVDPALELGLASRSCSGSSSCSPAPPTGSSSASAQFAS